MTIILNIRCRSVGCILTTMSDVVYYSDAIFPVTTKLRRAFAALCSLKKHRILSQAVEYRTRNVSK